MVNREKQADVLRRTQAKRKEQKKEQVLKAIQEIQKHSKPLTFKNIAIVAGCSVSYLYKWDDIKAYIHELQQKKETTLNSLEEPEGKYQPHSLKTLHQVAKDKIRKLEAEIRELKRQNEVLRGHVAEVYEIRDENERLLTQLRELTSSIPSSKVIPIQASIKKTIQPYPTNKQCAPASATDESGSAPRQEPMEEIVELIKDMGIKIGTKLKQEITNRDPELLKSAIEAFKQYREGHPVKSQEACLLSMIRSEAEPNTVSKPNQKKPQQKVISTPSKSPKELVSLDKLKQLSNIFNSKND